MADEQIINDKYQKRIPNLIINVRKLFLTAYVRRFRKILFHGVLPLILHWAQATKYQSFPDSEKRY